MNGPDPEVWEAILRFECEFCGALAGMPCMTKRGMPVARFHTVRYERWREAVDR